MHKHIPKTMPRFADVVASASLCVLAYVIGWAALSGKYTMIATPRAFGYLITASILLIVLAFGALMGWFHVDSSDAKKILVALLIPALLIVVPLNTIGAYGGDQGWDPYAGGKAIEIVKSGRSKPQPRRDGQPRSLLRGLDASRRTIRMSEEDFGAWFDEIDHHPERYEGFRVEVAGYISHATTLAPGQFRIARQLMSCCVLDMSPFGFVATYDRKDATASRSNDKQKMLQEHQWVQVTARIHIGEVGSAGHTYRSPVLHIEHMSLSKPMVGYFYRS